MTIHIIECTKCKAPQVFKENMKDSEIPVALEVNLNGGYGMFYDNWNDKDFLKLMLCHKCAHELMDWLDTKHIGHMGHPKTEDIFCNGWQITEDEIVNELTAGLGDEAWWEHMEDDK